MTWFRVDDKLHDHPKLRKLRDRKLPALGLWTACGSWSGDNLTDGFVPAEIVQRFDPDEGLAKRLVEVGLWVHVEVDDEPGYQFHQWIEHQPTKAEVERKRAEARERMRKRRAGSSPEQDVTPDVSSQEVRANTTGSAREVRHPDPTRPVVKEEKTSANAAASTATDLFDEFWKHYPRKVQKVDARKAWKSAVKGAAPERIIRGAQLYAQQRDGQDPAFTKHPASWLRAGGYDDEPDQGRLSLVQAGPELRTFVDYVRHHAARAAAQLIRKPYVPEPQPPSDKTSRQVWEEQQADRWLNSNAAAIRAALAHEESA